MFDHPTVLILGAGSSHDFGLPLGTDLWAQIYRNCRAYLDVPDRYGKPGFAIPPEQVLRSYLSDARRDDAKGYALFSSIREVRAERPSFSIHELCEAIERGNVHPSVDDFLRDNPSLRRPITALIAGQLFETLYENRGHGIWRRKDGPFGAELRVGGSTAVNWVRRFAGHARSHLANRTGPALMTIINFNYDRIFETILREVWEQTERKYARFEECFELLYPYGVFESLEHEVQDAGEYLLRQRDRLSLAGTVSDDEQLIQERVLNADRIYLCGISCAESAVKLLALDRTDAPICAQNFEQRDRRLNRLLQERLQVPADHIDGASMAGLVSNGFFDQGFREREIVPQRQERDSKRPRNRKRF